MDDCFVKRTYSSLSCPTTTTELKFQICSGTRRLPYSQPSKDVEFTCCGMWINGKAFYFRLNDVGSNSTMPYAMYNVENANIHIH